MLWVSELSPEYIIFIVLLISVFITFLKRVDRTLSKLGVYLPSRYAAIPKFPRLIYRKALLAGWKRTWRKKLRKESVTKSNHNATWWGLDCFFVWNWNCVVRIVCMVLSLMLFYVFSRLKLYTVKSPFSTIFRKRPSPIGDHVSKTPVKYFPSRAL